MDDTLIMWISIIAISAMGTLAHFLYDLTGEHRAIGLFTAINESTWEHLKIAITPFPALGAFMMVIIMAKTPIIFAPNL